MTIRRKTGPGTVNLRPFQGRDESFSGELSSDYQAPSTDDIVKDVINQMAPSRKADLDHIKRYIDPLSLDQGDPRKVSVFTAMYDNGMMQGLACGIAFPAKSRRAGLEVPSTLHPTLLQLDTVHWQWVDRFPFADARDEIILNMGKFNEEEFLRDLFSIESFSIEPGCKSWDPLGWRICPTFQRKWGWLFPSVLPQSINRLPSPS